MNFKNLGNIENLIIEISNFNELEIVKLVGEFEVFNAYHVENILLNLLGEESKKVAVDLRKVSFIDSVGLNVLEQARKRSGQFGGNIYILHKKGARSGYSIERALQLTGLDKKFRSFRNPKELQKFLKKNTPL